MIEGHGILILSESVSRFVLRIMFSKGSIPSSGAEQACFWVSAGRWTPSGARLRAFRRPSKPQGHALKVSWKTWAVLTPGGLLGAGVGAVLAVYLGAMPFEIVNTVQTVGIGLAVGSLILRVVLSERGLRLTEHAGLLSNWICTFLAGGVLIFLFQSLPQPAIARIWPPLIAGSWILAVALVVFGLLLSASRIPANPASKD
jgi:hypothetical protein